MPANPLLDDFDSFYLVGQRAPGQAFVTSPTKPQNWDEQKGQGTGGSTLTYGGPGNAAFDVRLEMWEPEHFLEWAAFRELVDKPPKGPDGKAVAAMEARHPVVDDLGCNSVVVTERTGLVALDDTGKWGVTIKFKQWRKPVPVLGNSKASATIDAPGGGKIGVFGQPAKSLDELELQTQAFVNHNLELRKQILNGPPS